MAPDHLGADLRARMPTAARRALLNLTYLAALALPQLAAAAADLSPLFEQFFQGRQATPGAFVLDVARIVESGNSVAVRVDASALEPQPSRLHLLMPRNPEPLGLSVEFRPPARAQVQTRVRLSGTQNLTAVAEWPDGRLTSVSVPVLVTLGACIDENYGAWSGAGTGRPATVAALAAIAREDATAGGSGAGIGAVRLRLPEHAETGALVAVRTLVRHPMETGYRIDTRSERVPRNLIERFRMHRQEDVLIDARLGPAIAADPYLEFALVADISAELVLEWTEDRGAVHTERRSLTVGAAP